MKVFALSDKNNDFKNINIATASRGFYEMGFEIVKYEKVSDIIDYLCKDDIVLGGVGQVRKVLTKWGSDTSDFDYPDVMKEFLGRKVWKSTINHINSHPEEWGIFVKPLEDKKFTGRVIREPKDLIGCGSCYDNAEVYCSEVLDIKREWRAFITYDKLVDIRPYFGDYHYQFDVSTIDRALEAFKTWENRPFGCSIDFGVTSDNKTVLIEVNDGYALGCYGLDCLSYAKLISARWSQLNNIKDECVFLH